MEKICSKILLFMISFCLIFELNAFAADNGTINFKAINSANKENISNLTVDIYQIGKYEDDTFVLNSEFQNQNIVTNDNTESNINLIKNIAKEVSKPLLTKTTNSNGEINLNDLELGLYLFVQNGTEDTITMQTMLVVLPEVTEEGINNNLTVKPKIVVKEKTSNDNGTVASSSTSSSQDSVLPYTGIVNWPLPILVISAIVLFSIGWIVTYVISKKKIN